MQHTITMTTAPLFSDEVRALIAEDLDRPDDCNDPFTVFAVGAKYECKRYEGKLRQDDHPVAYWVKDGRVIKDGLHDAPIPVIKKAAAVYFATEGQTGAEIALAATIPAMARRSAIDESHYHAVCLSFGLAILPAMSFYDLVTESIKGGSLCVTQEAVACRMGFICDSGLSRHEQIEALRLAQAFTDRMLADFMANAHKSNRWVPYLEGHSFKVVPEAA